MTSKTFIEINDKVSYKHETNLHPNRIFVIIVIVLIIFFCSLVLCILQNNNWEPLVMLTKFKRIRKNIDAWESLIKEKTSIEISKGKLLSSVSSELKTFKIFDFDDYYVIGRLNEKSFLPEFIRRGNSGPWLIKKLGKTDDSALQFAEYVLNKYKNKQEYWITCGIDMFNKLGYSGYFIQNFPCERALFHFSKSISN